MTKKKESNGKRSKHGAGKPVTLREHKPVVKTDKTNHMQSSKGGIDDFTRRTMRWAIFPFVLIFGVLIRLMPDAAIALFGGAGKNYCVWVDEVWTLMLDRLPFLDALYLIHHFDAVPPLSYLLLRMTPQMDDGTILRIVPGLLSAMALAAFLWFGSRHLKRDEIWLVGILLALSPIHFWYSLNLRYYGLMELIAALFIVATARLAASGRGIRVKEKCRGARETELPTGTSFNVHLWLTLAVAGLLTHNLFTIVIFAAAIALVGMLGRRTFALFTKPLQYAWAAIPVIYWFQVFLWQREFVGGYELTMSMPGIGELFAAYRDFLILYFQPPSLTAVVISIVVVVIPISAFAYDTYKRANENELLPVIAPVCAWIALLPPVIAAILMYAMQNPQLLSRRYLIPSGIAFLVVWAHGCLKIKPKSIRLVFILAVVMFNLMGLYAVLFIQSPPDWKTAAETMTASRGESTWVISREATVNLVVSESGCLATYLPDKLPSDFRHYTVSLEGPSPQVFALAKLVSRMSERTIAGFSRYYPPHISMSELQALIENVGNKTISSLSGSPSSLPDKIYVAYPSTAYYPPSADVDMGEILSEYYTYTERKKIGGITIDRWDRE